MAGLAGTLLSIAEKATDIGATALNAADRALWERAMVKHMKDIAPKRDKTCSCKGIGLLTETPHKYRDHLDKGFIVNQEVRNRLRQKAGW
ncbi:MAG TPA: hypothetical protein VFZ48_00580 [Candidatus Saccharimonadales bacterium]